MDAMTNWNIISANSEAQRVCDMNGITDYGTYQQIAAGIRHQGFMRSIEPFIKQKCRILSTRMLSHIVINKDGSLGEQVYKPLPKEAEECLATIDELIAAEAKRWGFNEPDPPPIVEAP